VAQVHRGILKDKYALKDGTREVAVKVLSPAGRAQSMLNRYLLRYFYSARLYSLYSARLY
jgi:predicted unusual protein kinase regulating ubiquinone biosynthesis (AarF/ABC1/UbiB family)